MNLIWFKLPVGIIPLTLIWNMKPLPVFSYDKHFVQKNRNDLYSSSIKWIICHFKLSSQGKGDRCACVPEQCNAVLVTLWNIPGTWVCEKWTLKPCKYAIIFMSIIPECGSLFDLGALLIPSLVVRLLWPPRREAPWGGLSIDCSYPTPISMSKQYPTRQAMEQSTSAEEEITIDAGILAAIKVVVREEMGVISARLDNIDKTLV